MPLDHEILASEMRWVYRTKISRRYRRMRQLRARAFFAMAFRGHRRLLRLHGGRRPAGVRTLGHLTAGQVRRLVAQLRRRRSHNPRYRSPSPLLRGSRWGLGPHRSVMLRRVLTPFHRFGTAAFAAKRDYR